MKNKNIYYTTETEDFVHSSKQDIKIRDNFKWIHTNIFYIVISRICTALFTIFAYIYTKLVFNTKIINKKVLKDHKNYFLYLNHTHPFADVINPFVITAFKKPYIIISKENLGVPFIGRFLPLFGCLPIPEEIHKMAEFQKSINHYYKKGSPIIIYPEAHVWPYCSFIRHFPKTSFTFAVDNNAPIYTATTTYHQRKFFKKPKIKIYIDGPFYIDNSLEIKKAKAEDLALKAYNSMCKNSQYNTYEYIKYLPKD